MNHPRTNPVPIRLRRTVAATVALAAFTLLAAAPMFIRPEALPGKRLISNIEGRLKKAPKDHHLIYTLARVHYLCFVNQSALVPAVGTGASARPARRHLAASFLGQQRYARARELVLKRMGLDPDAPLKPEVARKFSRLQREEYRKLEKAEWRPSPIGKKELAGHARTAMQLFDKAIGLAPENALYQLGRASLGEQVLDLVKSGKLDKALPGLTRESVADYYFRTFELALEPDLKGGHVPVAGLADLVSYEAGHAFLRLVETSKQGPREKTRVTAVRRGLLRMKELNPGPVTPILVGANAGDSLERLLDPGSTVWFDLDGDGTKEHWPWVKPDAGILVWSPLGEQRIESGRQLFGSVTFFLFHRDGYAALRLLDDDGDGFLRGLELDGLAIWYDRDGNGRSDRAELVTALDAGVASIATRADGSDGAAPRSSRGVVYAGGRAVPTIDWIATPR